MFKLNHGEDRYEFQFTPAPPQDDRVIRHLKLLIRESNKTNILFPNINIRVSPTTSASLFCPPSPAHPEHDMKTYTFSDNFHEFPLTT